MGLFDKKRDRSNAFSEMAKGKDNKEVRHLEEQMLKPRPIETYVGEQPENYGIDSLTVSIVFPDEQVKKLFAKHMKISYSKVKKAQYMTDISMLINLVKQLDSGKLVYKGGKFGLGLSRIKKRRPI